MAYKQQPTTYLEKELMFKSNKLENKIGYCKLNRASPSQISLEVTEDGQVHYNYIKSVAIGKFDNMLCVTSQNGVTYFFFESREDRDEWYSTIQQLQRGLVPSFPRKRESLPARPPDTSPKPRDRQQPASSPSTLQEIFKKELETEMSRNLKKPHMKKGSGSYVNMDYNPALQNSKESYNLLTVLHGIQNVQINQTQSGASVATEDELYDMPEGSTTGPNEERIYEELDNMSDGSDFGGPTEDQIYDVPLDEHAEEEQFYDDTEFEAGARDRGAWGGAPWDSRQTTNPPPLPPRPAHILSPEDVGESDDTYEPLEPDLPPPIPTRPASAAKNVPIQIPGGTWQRKMAVQPPKTQPKSRRMSAPSTQAPFQPGEIITGRSRTHSTSDHSLADELALKISQRARSSTMSNVSSSQESGHINTLPKVPDRPNAQAKPMGKSTEVNKVRHRSHDKQDPQTRPTSGVGVTDELAMKLAQRSSALLKSESTGSGLDGQTPHGQACNSHRDYRGTGPSDEQQGASTTALWKLKQDHGNKLPKTQLLPKKKAIVPPPTPAKKSQSSASIGQNITKQPKSLPPKPSPKAFMPSQSDEIYEDTEVRPPPPAVSYESTGSGLEEQTPHGQACNSHRDYRGTGPSDEHQGESTTAPWKLKQDHGNKLPNTHLLPKKKAIVPPPTPVRKSQSSASIGQNITKQPKSPPPKPSPKPFMPSQSDEIYEDTEVRPPPPAVKPKLKNIKPGTVREGVEIVVRIPRQAAQRSMAVSVSFSDRSDSVVIERTDLPDYLHVGDKVLQIGDIDVRSSSAAFVAECWKRVSETQIRVRILRR